MLKLDKNEFEAGIGLLKKATNEQVCADIKQLAASLSVGGDDNELLTQVYEACVTFQRNYNDSYCPSMGALAEEFKQEFDITEWLEKMANVGTVDKMDAGFQTSGISAENVIR